MTEYKYKVSDFEGPLDLLLYLIEKNKVDIYNIPIVEITDQFNAYVADIDTFDVDYASKFFVMAATLLQIKSRLLLPKQPKLAEEEEEEKTVLLVPPTQITGKLIRCATGEEFVLNGSMNIVGKSKIRADIRIQNNPAIGNVHCKITREENAFYLEDNKSLNGTYLENVKLKPEVKTLLETENRIRLADEEFIFRAE